MKEKWNRYLVLSVHGYIEGVTPRPIEHEALHVHDLGHPNPPSRGRRPGPNMDVSIQPEDFTAIGIGEKDGHLVAAGLGEGGGKP